MADSGSAATKWIFGLLGTVATGLIIWYLTGTNSPLHHSGPEVTGGSLESVNINEYSPCCTFAIKASIQGYNGQHCELYAILVNPATGNTIGTSYDVGWFEATAGNDAGVWNGHIPVNATPGKYEVRFFLNAPNGTQLDQKDSSTFNIY